MKRFAMKAAFAALAIAALPLSAAVVAAPAAAQMPAMMQSIPLTPAVIENFIRSYPAIKEAAPAIGKKYGIDGDDDSAAGWGAWMMATQAWGELNGMVQQYGFSDFGNWLQTTMSVAMAYSFAKEGPQMDTQMAEAIDQIKNNPSIPEAQKQMMLQQMQASSAAIAGVRPPQENIDAITPYLTQLAPLFD
ncbi:MAG TPA: hypothetical protein VFB16_07170 [Bauldia sp.]|nr:hypothetical protein [Bauldia sp.]